MAFTSCQIPSGVTKSKSSQEARVSLNGIPKAVPTMNSASIPRTVLSTKFEKAHHQKSGTEIPGDPSCNRLE